MQTNHGRAPISAWKASAPISIPRSTHVQRVPPATTDNYRSKFAAICRRRQQTDLDDEVARINNVLPTNNWFSANICEARELGVGDLTDRFFYPVTIVETDNTASTLLQHDSRLNDSMRYLPRVCVWTCQRHRRAWRRGRTNGVQNRNVSCVRVHR